MSAASGAASSLRVFILGSCVSRDAFSLPSDGLELVGYFARTSLASAFHPQVAPRSLAQLATAIPSSFQRRMVQADLDKRWRPGDDIIDLTDRETLPPALQAAIDSGQQPGAA